VLHSNVSPSLEVCSADPSRQNGLSSNRTRDCLSSTMIMAHRSLQSRTMLSRTCDVPFGVVRIRQLGFEDSTLPYCASGTSPFALKSMGQTALAPHSPGTCDFIGRGMSSSTRRSQICRLQHTYLRASFPVDLQFTTQTTYRLLL
jgi:hypothetical protein